MVVLGGRLLICEHFSLNRGTQDWYGTAPVSKRPSHRSSACLRAQYCLVWRAQYEEQLRRPNDAVFSAETTQLFRICKDCG